MPEITVPQDAMPEIGNVPLPAVDTFACSDCGETFDGRNDTIVVEFFRQQPVGVYHDRCLARKREAAWKKFALRCASYLNRDQMAQAAKDAGVHATFCNPEVPPAGVSHV